MKTNILFTLAFALIQWINIYAQTNIEEFVFPELDAALVSIWISDENGNINTNQAIDDVTDQWHSIKPKILNLEIKHFNNQDFINDIENLIKELQLNIENKNASHIKSYSYHLLWEFRALRQCFLSVEYPLDILFDVYDHHEKISWIVNDKLMGLTEWYEFEDIIQDYMCAWGEYTLINKNALLKYNPHINIPLHNRLKENLEECNYALMVAVDGGYQDNFILPCNKIEEALYDLFGQYRYKLVKFEL